MRGTRARRRKAVETKRNIVVIGAIREAVVEAETNAEIKIVVVVERQQQRQQVLKEWTKSRR